jgi:hypothetical protein
VEERFTEGRRGNMMGGKRRTERRRSEKKRRELGKEK